MQKYKIFNDKIENFECTVNVTGASLNGSIARLILEIESGPKIILDGKIIDKKCIVPIKKLPGILDDGIQGNMKLEMIVEDTYFTPWQSEFIVESSKKVSVLVNENKTEHVDNKPKIEISNIVNLKKETKQHGFAQAEHYAKKLAEKIITESDKLSYEILANDIAYKNLIKHKKQINEIFNNFFKNNPSFKPYKNEIIKNTIHLLEIEHRGK